MANPVPSVVNRVANGKAPSYKRQIRMQKAARLEAQLYKDPEIAAFLGISPAGLAQMKADPEYDRIRIEVLTGVISNAEEELIKDTDYKYERLRAMVPMALRNLYDLAQSPNEQSKRWATAEILDREGTMAKVSRIGLASADQGGVGTLIDDEIASNLLGIQKIQAERQKTDAENNKKPPTTGSTTIQ